jgi:hypothetical protein
MKKLSGFVCTIALTLVGFVGLGAHSAGALDVKDDLTVSNIPGTTATITDHNRVNTDDVTGLLSLCVTVKPGSPGCLSV